MQGQEPGLFEFHPALELEQITRSWRRALSRNPQQGGRGPGRHQQHHQLARGAQVLRTLNTTLARIDSLAAHVDAQLPALTADLRRTAARVSSLAATAENLLRRPTGNCRR